jgi:hypothetical protein
VFIDADGFEIPCLKLEKPGTAEKDAAETEDSKSSPQQVTLEPKFPIFA